MWIKTWGIIVDTIREAILKFTVITFFILSSLFLIFFLLFLNIDVVEGTVSIIKVFGNQVGKEQVDEFLTGIEIGFSIALYYTILFFAIFSISNIIPNMLEKGRIDIYLSRPIHRIHLLFGKALGTLAIIIFNTFYLLIGMWLILTLKLGTYHIEFLYTGIAIVYVFLIFYAFNTFIGIVSKNSLVAIMVCYFIIIFDAILYGIVSVPGFSNTSIKIIYWILPKSTAISASFIDLIKKGTIQDFTGYWVSGLFGLFFVVISSIVFVKKDY